MYVIIIVTTLILISFKITLVRKNKQTKKRIPRESAFLSSKMKKLASYLEQTCMLAQISQTGRKLWKEKENHTIKLIFSKILV